MKITFLSIDKINGKNVERIYGCSFSVYPTENLAISYASSILKNAGHKVAFFSVFELAKDRIPSADIYIIHSVYQTAIFDLKLIKKIRKRVYVFGPMPTMNPEKYLLLENIFILRGEIEEILLSAIANPTKTKSVSFLKNGKIKNNPSAGPIKNLDLIPFPDRGLFKQNYFNPKLFYKKNVYIMTSRGCAYSCYFCVPNSISWARELEWKRNKKGKPPVTVRSVKNIVDEILELYDMGFREFSFTDDQFIVGERRILQLLSEIKKLKINFGILARCDKLLNPKIVRALAAAGCCYVDLGIESFDQNILDDIGKQLKKENIYKSIKLLNRNNIEPKLNIMFGTSKLENEKIIKNSINETLKLPVNYCMYSIATPFEGTEFYKFAKKNSLIISDYHDPLKSSISYPQLSSQRLQKLIRQAYLKFYLRPRIIYSQVKKIKSPSNLRQLLLSIINFLKNMR